MSKTQTGILYDNLLQNNKDAILFLKGTKIIDANQRALDFFEVKKEDFIGKEIYKFSQNKKQTKKRAEKRRKGIPEYYTATLQTPNSLREAEVYAIPIDTENLTSISIIRDVTEYNRLDRKYRTIFERSADLIFVTNASGVVFINPSGLEYLGLDNEKEILGKSTLNFIHPDYHEMADKYAALRRAGGNPPHQYRSKMIRKDGTVLDVEFNASFIMWDGVPSSLTIARDIGEQVRLEKELMESKDLLSGFIESATDGFSLLDKNMRYVMVNDTELKYSRRKREDFIGKHILEVFPDLDEKRYEGYKRALETGEPVQYQDAMTLPERGLRLDFSAFKAGNFLGIIAKDITETRRTQDQLAYQANLLQNVSDAIISMDLKLNIISWNKAAERLYGYSEEEVIGENIEDLLKNQYPNETREISSRLMMKKDWKGEWKGEIQQYSRDGRQLNVLVSITPILNDNGKRVGIVSVNRDITEQRQLEIQLSGFIESATDGITILDENLHYIMVNDAWLNLTGLKKEEVIGKHVLDIFPEIKKTERYQAYKNVLETGNPANFPNSLPVD
ncbi:PAS domain S-box protein, partial [archaeon]|nr:PAS domain S-box protein [archaeon]